MKKLSFSREHTAKMFSLEKFFVSECIFKLVCFGESCRESGICFTRSVFTEKYLNRYWFGMAYLDVFLITVRKTDTAGEVYLELFQTHMLGDHPLSTYVEFS